MASNTNPAYQIYPADILRSADLRKCSWQTRGIWWDILALMWFEKEQGKMRGTKAEICRLLGCTISELDQLLEENKFHKFANVTNRNGIVTIINRHMYKRYIERKGVKKRVKQHREKKKRKSNEKVTPPSSSSSSFSCNNTVTYMNPTLQDCYNAAVLVGITEQQAKRFYEHYKPQGWIWGNNVPMCPPLQDCLVRWRNNGYKFEKKETIKEKLENI